MLGSLFCDIPVRLAGGTGRDSKHVPESVRAGLWAEGRVRGIPGILALPLVRSVNSDALLQLAKTQFSPL